MQTVVSMKWGSRYPADYVNRLWSMVTRNTRQPTRLLCYTDDASGLDPAIETYPLPPYDAPPAMRWDGWRKISVWGPEVAGLREGQDALFLDLDLVVTGSLDALFTYAPEASYCVIENWTQPGRGVGNTSVFRWRVGAHPEVFVTQQADPDACKAAYRIEQVYVSAMLPEQTFWPKSWCASFKHSLLPRWPMNFVRPPTLPAETRIVAFTGRPDPHEARDGIWPVKAGWKKLYKHVRPTPWIAEHWR